MIDLGAYFVYKQVKNNLSIMKQKKIVLQSDNMQESFKALLRKIRDKSKVQLPLDDESYFKSFAESMKVDDDKFKYHYVSFAIVCHEPIKSNGKSICLTSIELHALDTTTMIDSSVPMLIGHKKEVSEYINQEDPIIIDALIENFMKLNMH